MIKARFHLSCVIAGYVTNLNIGNLFMIADISEDTSNNSNTLLLNKQD